MFDNLKSFIRHGKSSSERRRGHDSAGEDTEGLHHPKSQGSSTIPTNIANNEPNAANIPSGGKLPSVSVSKAQDAAEHAAISERKRDEARATAVKHIVNEEQEKRKRLPKLAGLERFELLEEMGDGAFSVVYRALDREKMEQRAIKVVTKDRLGATQKAAVLKEAAIMRQLDHPNIVKMHAFLETDTHYFIVLELVAGGELFHQIVRLTYFSEDLARHVICQVAQAVRYLHNVAGVVHRDIKPENLLFSPVEHVPSTKQVLRPGDDESKEDEGEFQAGIGGGGVGTIKLADFGLSKIIWNSHTMTPCGTVGYTAPEIVKDERYSRSVDMWALGCVLYTLLCGFPPFYDESIEVLTRKVARGQYTFLSPWWDEISASAKDLVSRLLTVDPSKRLTIDNFFEHPWVTQDGSHPIEQSSEVSAHLSTGAFSPGKRARDPARDLALRDAFDVSNAVYRMEEEGQATQARKGLAKTAITEEEEEDEEYGNHVDDSSYAPSDVTSDEEAQDLVGSVEVAHIDHIASGVNAIHLSGESGELNSNTPSSGVAAKRSSSIAKTGRAHHRKRSQHSIDREREREKERERERERENALRHAPRGGNFFDLHLEGATLLERRRNVKPQATA